jgi:D-alanyl-D-alanine carboxypeptidase
MNAGGNVSFGVSSRLCALIAALPNESILRVRRKAMWWEGSNRGGLEPRTCLAFTRAFRTASVTKTFTAALVMLLIEDGVLTLEAPLSLYLPPAICDRIHVLGGVSRGAQITIAQLLRHRSGVFDYATSQEFHEHVNSAPYRKWSALDLLDEAIANGEPYFRPGEGLAYSDTGYVLLALIIEAVTHLPLALAYRRRLLEPLKLLNTYLEGCEPSTNWPVAHAFAGVHDTFELDPSFDTFGGGGLVSTAADLDHFITSLLQDRVFCKAGTLRSMMEGTFAPMGTGTRKVLTAAGLSEFAIAEYRFWGHLGHWNSFMLHSLECDISICGSFNQSQEDPRHKRIHEAVVTEVMGW